MPGGRVDASPPLRWLTRRTCQANGPRGPRPSRFSPYPDHLGTLCVLGAPIRRAGRDGAFQPRARSRQRVSRLACIGPALPTCFQPRAGSACSGGEFGLLAIWTGFRIGRPFPIRCYPQVFTAKTAGEFRPAGPLRSTDVLQVECPDFSTTWRGGVRAAPSGAVGVRGNVSASRMSHVPPGLRRRARS